MKRQMYRSVWDGELGEKVVKEGKEYIRLNRPAQELLRPYNPNDWKIEADEYPLTPNQVGAICWAADKALCKALGLHAEARKEFINLRDEDRLAWSEHGPSSKQVEEHPARGALFDTIKALFSVAK